VERLVPKVLVVDDSLSVRKVVEKALEGRSLQVLSAASGAEAIERIERDRPDVVVCDVVLPDKDGYQVCQFVRTHPAIGKTPVLLISGVVNRNVLARAAEVQSSDVMFKPFAAGELARKIDHLLADRGDGAAPPATGRPPATASAPPAVSPRAARDNAGRSAVPGEGIKERLAWLAGTPGVRFAVLADRAGLLIESAGELAPDTEVAGALASCLAEASDGIGRDLGQGALLGTMLEYEGGILLLHGVGQSALLAVLVGDPGALGKIRYYVKKTLTELARSV
jgi:CheY-like chemotaxis protein/predicted regulator of Ras-like GTPase activity (Roadblock/LC7/MglB family)